jgi:hypothetical protein
MIIVHVIHKVVHWFEAIRGASISFGDIIVFLDILEECVIVCLEDVSTAAILINCFAVLEVHNHFPNFLSWKGGGHSWWKISCTSLICQWDLLTFTCSNVPQCALPIRGVAAPSLRCFQWIFFSLGIQNYRIFMPVSRYRLYIFLLPNTAFSAMASK